MRGVRLHALAQLAYEGIMDDLAAGGGAATNATTSASSQGGCTGCSLPDASGGFTDITLFPETMFIAARIIQESPICKSATIYPNPLAVRTHLMLYYNR